MFEKFYPEKNIINEKNSENSTESNIDLWFSLIDDAQIDDSTKQKLKSLLETYNSWETNKSYYSKDDAIYGTLHALLTVAEKDPNKEEAIALFHNLRDDMWEDYKK